MPTATEFLPRYVESEEIIIMTVDEYETIRLIDLEGLMQEQCALSMNIARTSVVSIYGTARHKLADALINGKRLIIEGGDIEIAGENSDNDVRNCRRHRHHLTREENT